MGALKRDRIARAAKIDFCVQTKQPLWHGLWSGLEGGKCYHHF